MFLKQSTAYTRMFFMVSSTDHLTAKTSASPSVSVSKAGGAFGAAGGTVTEVSNGWYKIALTTTDTNTLGDLAYHVTGTGADDTDFADGVIAVDLADAVAFGLSRLDAAVTTRLAPTTAGRTLDVTATGEAGIDWANIGAPTTTVALSGTTVGTVTTLTNAPPDESGVTTLLARLTAGRATNLDNLDAAVSSRSTYAGADTAGTTTLLSRLSATRATLLDNLAALVSHSGTAQAGAASTVTLAAGASATDSIYNGQTVVLLTATGAGQARVITGYVGATKVATVDRAWQTNPDNTSTYALLSNDAAKTNSSLEVVSASVTGAVGSVTGAVGSVTGNVGGNVVGSVASVSGNVGGNVTGSVGSIAAGGIVASSFGAGAVDAAALATDAGQEIADRMLLRNIASGSDGTRTVRDVMRFLRNKKSIAAGTLTVTQEDDSTSAWTAVVTTAAGNPIDSIDPA